jgi:nitric oxide reductase NorQ protein
VAASLVRLSQALRSLTDHDLEETASTRLLVAAARLSASGMPMLLACRTAVVNALTDDPATASGLHEVVRAVMGDGR